MGNNILFYVSVNGVNSILVFLPCGIVQGSILGPILYSIYVSPLFDISKLTKIADENICDQVEQTDWPSGGGYGNGAGGNLEIA